MTNRPAGSYLAGLIDMAADMGLRTVALVNEDTLFPKAIARGASELARARGLRVVLAEEFSRGTRDFSPILSRVRDADADVLAVATYFEDTVAITRRLRELAVNPRMYGVVHGVAYAGCQILVEAIKRAGSLDGEKIRAEILKPDLNTVYGRFKVDQDGFQIAKRALMFQWQEGKKAIVWPYELAPSKPRFPTPPWSQR